MRGRPLGPAHRRRLERCWREIPPPGRPLYVVAMLSRAESAIRIEIGGGLDLPALTAFLERLGATEQASRVAALAPVLMDAERLHLSFDLLDPAAPTALEGSAAPAAPEGLAGPGGLAGPESPAASAASGGHPFGFVGSAGSAGSAGSESRASNGSNRLDRLEDPNHRSGSCKTSAAHTDAGVGDRKSGWIGPRVGIEASFPRQPGREPRWNDLLARMTEAGLCSAEAAREALAWPGRDSVLTAPQVWPTDKAVHTALPGSAAPRISPDDAARSTLPTPRCLLDLPITPEAGNLPHMPDDAFAVSRHTFVDSMTATFQPAAGGAAPGTCVRCLSHVKLVCDGGLPTTAKVYLLYTHLRGRR
jgi:hypothetical protein